MWRINIIIKVSNIQSNSTSVHIDILKFDVSVCCAVYLLIQAIPATSCMVRQLVVIGNGDFNYSPILILRPPKRCIIRATVAKSTMPAICKCSWNILVTFCWFQLAKYVDRCQFWWNTNWNNWSVHRVFVWRHRFLLYTSCDDVLFLCVSFFKTPQNVCKPTWWRQNGIVFAWCDFSPGKWTHTSAQNI